MEPTSQETIYNNVATICEDPLNTVERTILEIIISNTEKGLTEKARKCMNKAVVIYRFGLWVRIRMNGVRYNLYLDANNPRLQFA